MPVSYPTKKLTITFSIWQLIIRKAPQYMFVTVVFLLNFEQSSCSV